MMEKDVSATKSPSTAKVGLRVVLDIAFLILVLLPVIVLKVLRIEPFKRGFFCEDESLTYPYKPYSDDIVPIPLLFLMTLIVPLLLIIGTETAGFCTKIKRNAETKTSVWKMVYAELVVTSYKYVGLFLFGFMCNLTLTMVVKYVIGRLRPYYLTVCQPNMTTVNCTDHNGFAKYIEEDLCTGDPDLIAEARQSFPSGHSSTAMYAAVYVAMYLYLRLHCSLAVLLRPALQLVALLLGLVCCVSRVSDYKHHWNDVLAGGIIGVCVAITTILFVLTTTQDNKYQRTCNGVPHHHLDPGADEEMAYAPLYTDDPKWSRQRRMIQTE